MFRATLSESFTMTPSGRKFNGWHRQKPYKTPKRGLRGLCFRLAGELARREKWRSLPIPTACKHAG